MAAAAPPTAPAGGQMTPQQINALQRQTVLRQAVEMRQVIYSNTIATLSSGNNVINIPPRNVGLVKKFIVEISGTATANTATSTATAYGL